jgi:hypothetical protein
MHPHPCTGAQRRELPTGGCIMAALYGVQVPPRQLEAQGAKATPGEWAKADESPENIVCQLGSLTMKMVQGRHHRLIS